MNKEKREQLKLDIAKTMHSFEEMTTKNYKWYSKACGIHNEELTLQLMKEIIREGLHNKIYHSKKTNRLEVRK